MLTAIRVGNFKAFADSQRIPIRPLTLIYGANSSGKSSVLHSMILARHAQETGDLDVHRTNLGGESVDLGGFRQFIHRRDLSRRMEWTAELDTSSITGRLAELLAHVQTVTASLEIGLPQIEEMIEQDSIDSRTGKKIRITVPTGNMISAGNPEVMSYVILGDGKPLIQMSKRRDGKLQLDRLDHEHPIIREVIKAIVESSTTTGAIQSSDYEGLDIAINEVVPDIIALAGKFLPEGLAKSETQALGTQATLFPVSKGRRKEDLAAAIRFFIPRTLDELIRGINRTIQDELSCLQYLGPLRSYPPRHLAFSQHQDSNWYAGGGYAWDVIRRDAKVRTLVNTWLSAKDRLHTRYELRIRHLLTVDDLDADYTEIIKEIEKRFTSNEPYDWDLFGEIYSALDNIKEKEAKLSDIQELNLVDKSNDTIVSHRDVGIGISQVLPVLVGAYASQNKIIAIEQPEIHLHPALQADLGDLFLESALGIRKNTFLIETHSEHLILRILRRIRETTNNELPEGMVPIHPEDVSVIYIQPQKNGSQIIEIPVTPEGDFAVSWPRGFFAERAQELFG